MNVHSDCLIIVRMQKLKAAEAGHSRLLGIIHNSGDMCKYVLSYWKVTLD